MKVEGAETLTGFGSADPLFELNYFDSVWKTYDRYALAVIHSGLEPGRMVFINVSIVHKYLKMPIYVILFIGEYPLLRKNQLSTDRRDDTKGITA